MDDPSAQTAKPKRTDARRNQQTLLEAAAALFVTSGVEVPIRDIAAKAGVGTGTIYRHFPTRADLIIAVYHHQIEACAEAGQALLASNTSPYAALEQWINLFVDFLVTKHGLAAMLQSDQAKYEANKHLFLRGRLLPICDQLLEAAIAVDEVHSNISALELMRGVGNLCVGASHDPTYNARRMVGVLIAGLRQR
jgi:AcrR family transcriptional regulator